MVIPKHTYKPYFIDSVPYHPAFSLTISILVLTLLTYTCSLLCLGHASPHPIPPPLPHPPPSHPCSVGCIPTAMFLVTYYSLQAFLTLLSERALLSPTVTCSFPHCMFIWFGLKHLVTWEIMCFCANNLSLSP